MKKRLVSMLLASVMSLLFIVPAFADSAKELPAETNVKSQVDLNIDLPSSDGEDKICVDTQATQSVQSSSGSIEPFKLCKGNAGYARLEQSGSNGIYWNVNPKFSVYYYFTGEITITEEATGRYITSYPISAQNVAGLTSAGMVTVNLSSGRYTATLTGHCFDTNLTYSWVAPDCDTPFIAGLADFAAVE